jgi:hypothetical protein
MGRKEAIYSSLKPVPKHQGRKLHSLQQSIVGLSGGKQLMKVFVAVSVYSMINP